MVIASCLIMISCSNNDRYTKGDLSLSEWNKKTVDFAFENCELAKNGYNQDGMLPVRDENDNFISLKTDLENILEIRQLFLDTLMKSDFFIKIRGPITIDEIHNRSIKLNDLIASFDLYSNLKNVYSYSFDTENKVIIRVLAKSNPDSLRLTDNEKCINELPVGSVLDEITIKTTINKNESSEVSYDTGFMTFRISSH